MTLEHSLASAGGCYKMSLLPKESCKKCFTISKPSGPEQMNRSAHRHRPVLLALVIGILISIVSSASENRLCKYLSDFGEID